MDKIRARWRLAMKASFGLALLTALLSLLSQETHHLLLAAPLGSTGVILFLMPQSAFAKPHRVIGAHFLSALIGMIFVEMGALEWYWIGAATGASLLLITLLNLDHPPAGANPIVIMLLKPDWMFLFTPILAGTVAMVVGALIYNKFAHFYARDMGLKNCWLIGILLLGACAAKEPASPSLVPECQGGTTLETAIYFPRAVNEYEGVRSEYQWIGKCYPGWHKKRQLLVRENNKVYDLLEIEDSTHQTIKIYFHITNWFGKL